MKFEDLGISWKTTQHVVNMKGCLEEPEGCWFIHGSDAIGRPWLESHLETEVITEDGQELLHVRGYNISINGETGDVDFKLLLDSEGAKALLSNPDPDLLRVDYD